MIGDVYNNSPVSLKISNTRNCLICDNEFTPNTRQVVDGYGKYCSRLCYGVSLKGKTAHNKGKKYPELSGENHPNYVTRIDKECLFCENTFKTREKWGKKFCSAECLTLWRKSSNLGEGNPCWRGGKTSIARTIRLLDKYNLWRKETLQRDNYKCTICKSTEKLEVDHIIKFSSLLKKYSITTTKKALECEELWSLDNARTLCKACHLKTDTYGFKKSKI